MGQLMLNFIGLRPKLYIFDYERIAYFDIDENGEIIRYHHHQKYSCKGRSESCHREVPFMTTRYVYKH